MDRSTGCGHGGRPVFSLLGTPPFANHPRVRPARSPACICIALARLCRARGRTGTGFDLSKGPHMFLATLQRLIDPRNGPRVRDRRPRGLVLEALEDRTLPSNVNHLLIDPVNGQPFTWQNQIPSDPTHINIYYDFRAENGFRNQITPV